MLRRPIVNLHLHLDLGLGLLNRWSVPMAWTSAGLALNGCGALMAVTQPAETPGALDQQQQFGWNVGGENSPIEFQGAQTTDVSGGDRWREAQLTLAARLTPAEPRWTPYYSPTLFQSLEAPRNEDLRMAMRPVFTPQMDAAYRRGQALLSLLVEDGACRTDVALVLDLDGPDAVSVAAALAPCFDPVFVFANWPHPMGVVPAHMTLGAALYYLPTFESNDPLRSTAAAPVFVLDRQRLAPYTDEADRFDNRYLAGLPPREALAAAGIRHLLYVTPSAEVVHESDDLNDDLVAINDGGIDVKMLAMSDFSTTPLGAWADVPAGTPAYGIGSGPQFYFGGTPGSHNCFWSWYGWPRRSPSGPTALVLPVPPQFAPRCHFRPTARATFLSGAHLSPGGGGGGGGGWRSRPGFPHFAGFGRSGSMGRAHSGLSG